MAKEYEATGTVKFFNKEGNYGFVELDGSEVDAFIHAGLFGSGGFRMPEKGDRIHGLIMKSDKGVQFSLVKNLDRGERQVADKPASGKPLPETGEIAGEVIFFNLKKGFGFIKPVSGYEDVFLHITTVADCGFSGLDMVRGLKLKVCYLQQEKGPQATTIKPLDLLPGEVKEQKAKKLPAKAGALNGSAKLAEGASA